jgi:rRNA maturation endonuclease Nob1
MIENFVVPENNQSEFAEYVQCIACKKIMITDLGLEHCPSCGEFDSLMWVDENNKIVKIADFKIE